MNDNDAWRSSDVGSGPTSPDTAPPPGWYPDPFDSTRLRRWDGAAWTHDVEAAATAVGGAPAASGSDRCTRCGEGVAAGDAFCSSCGTPVSGPTPAATIERDPVVAGDSATAGRSTGVRVPRGVVIGLSTVAVAVVVLMLVVVTGVLDRGGSVVDPLGRTAALPVVPGAGTDFTETWAADLAGTVEGIAADAATIVTVEADYRGDTRDLELVGRRVGDGAEQFALRLDGAAGTVLVRDLDGGTLIDIPNHGLEGEGVFTVVDADGTELWTEDVGDNGASATLLDGDRVAVRTFGERPEIEVYTIADGTRLWSADGHLVGGFGDTMIVRDDEDLVALDGQGGEQWTRDLDDDTFPSARVGDGQLYVLEDSTLVALSIADGTELWKGRVDVADDWGSVDPVPGIGALVVGSDGTEVWSQDGELLWDDGDSLHGSVIELNGQTVRVVVTEPYVDEVGSGEIYDVRTGQRLSRGRLEDVWLWGEGSSVGDVITGNALLAKADDELTALSLEDDFEELWTIDARDSVGGAIVAGDGVAVVTYDGEGGSTLRYFR